MRKIVAIVLFLVCSAIIGPWFTAMMVAFVGGSAVLSVSYAVIGFVVLPWIAVSKLYEAVLWPNEAHRRRVEWRTGQKWNT